MALLKCKECGNPVSSKAPACQFCGAPVKKKTGCITKLVFVTFVMMAVAVFVSVMSSPAISPSRKSRPVATSPSEQPASEPQSATPKARYDIIKRWSIPNGGEGKVIAISPASATESGLAALAETLRQDTRNDRNAFAFIFSDVRAAQMRDRLDSLTSSERTFYHRHYVGNYRRNINTGLHEMEMHPTGMNGPSKTLKF